MRSSEEMPGNPWPHDRVISIEDDPNALVELLWIREAWEIRPEGDGPPRLLSGPAALSGRGVRGESEPPAPDRLELWRRSWGPLWERCLLHAGRTRDGDVLAAISAEDVGSAEREGLLLDLIGPTWREELGEEALTEDYDEWVAARFDDRMRRPPDPLADEPERRSLPALVTAWERGLTNLVEIPCRGTHTRVIGPHALLVTAETRADPDRFGRALLAFR